MYFKIFRSALEKERVVDLSSQEVFNLGPLFKSMREFSALTCLFVCLFLLSVRLINNC